ncbi:MAG: DEAD/DEAH box helicase [Ruminococcus flavefaciens]|nr:DEAD/DEAH box helicase [Ruminococcus flavefaciens]
MQIELRDYQKECVDTIDSEGKEGRHLVAMATGLGKTAIFANIKRRGRTLILSHRDELVRQPEKFYEGCSFGVEKAGEHADGEDVVSASVQTLYKDSRLARYAPDAFHTIIVDEAHHAAAMSYRKILDYFSGAKQILGVTATPKRGDNVRLTDVFDDIIFSRDLRWGIQNKWLSGVRCERVVASYKLSGIRKTRGDFNEKELEKAIGADTLATAAKAYVKTCHKKGRHTLIYCTTIKTCKVLHGIIIGLLPEKEKKTVKVLTGKDSPEERRAILEGFQKGSVRCIINCMVLTEGTDLPVCDTVINLRPTCNISLYQQMVGRGTRLHDGKDYCLVIDIVPDDERKIRNLCTAPSLFGIDPAGLPEKVKEKFKEDNDLVELCDEIAGTIGTGAKIAERMEVRVVLAEALMQGEIEVITGGDAVSSFKEAARRLQEHEEQEIGGSGLDFGDLYVTVMPDEGRRFVVRPSWNEEIYISAPDVLGKVTVDFHIAALDTQNQEKKHYIADIGFDEAVRLIRQYCMLSPEYTWYSWNRPMRERWEKQAATENQKYKLESCYSTLAPGWQDADSLNKLEASCLIDRKLDIDRKAAFVKVFKVGARQRQSTKDRKLAEFQEMEEQDQEAMSEGRAAFPEFKEKLGKAYEERAKQLEKQEWARKKALRKEAEEIQKGYFEFAATVKRYSGRSTEKQDGFIRSLFLQAAKRGYVPDIAPGNMQIRMSRTEACIMIEMLLHVNNDLRHREDAPLTINVRDMAEEASRIAACSEGSRQTFRVRFAAPEGNTQKTHEKNEEETL